MKKRCCYILYLENKEVDGPKNLASLS